MQNILSCQVQASVTKMEMCTDWAWNCSGRSVILATSLSILRCQTFKCIYSSIPVVAGFLSLEELYTLFTNNIWVVFQMKKLKFRWTSILMVHAWCIWGIGSSFCHYRSQEIDLLPTTKSQNYLSFSLKIAFGAEWNWNCKQSNTKREPPKDHCFDAPSIKHLMHNHLPLNHPKDY